MTDDEVTTRRTKEYVTIEIPVDEYRERRVTGKTDGRGRVNLGTDFADKSVELVILDARDKQLQE